MGEFDRVRREPAATGARAEPRVAGATGGSRDQRLGDLRLRDLQRTRGNRYVQRVVSGRERLSVDPAAVGAGGVAGPGAPLPHRERIQTAFGRHDIRSARAHTGPSTTSAAAALGALAYTTGEHVAFTGPADLHLAAHEAAHVIQQLLGAAPPGGLSAPGDRFERHADAVADAVVAGRSAEPLLDALTPGPRGAAGGPSVQLTALPYRIRAGARSVPVSKEISEMTAEELLLVTLVPLELHPAARIELTARLKGFSLPELRRLEDSAVPLVADVARAQLRRRRGGASGAPAPNGTPEGSGVLNLVADVAASGPTGNPLTVAQAAHTAATEINSHVEHDLEPLLGVVSTGLAEVNLAGDLAALAVSLKAGLKCLDVIWDEEATPSQQQLAWEQLKGYVGQFAQAFSGGLYAGLGAAGLSVPGLGVLAQTVQAVNVWLVLASAEDVRDGLERFRKQYDQQSRPDLATGTRLLSQVIELTEVNAQKRATRNAVLLINTLLGIVFNLASAVSGGVTVLPQLVTTLGSLSATLHRIVVTPGEDAQRQAHLNFLQDVMRMYPTQTLPALHAFLRELGLEPAEILHGDEIRPGGLELIKLKLASW